MSEDKFDIQIAQAERLRQLHSEILGACRTALSKAIEAGGILNEVKASLPHGEFTSWVDKNTGFNIRTAQRYMKIHENRDQINDSVSLLTDAHRLLSEPKESPAAKSNEEKLTELEFIIERGLRELADVGLNIEGILKHYGITFEEFFVLLKISHDEDQQKALQNFKDLCSRLHELYTRDSWKVLGYTSWKECLQKEFDIGYDLKHGIRNGGD